MLGIADNPLIVFHQGSFAVGDFTVRHILIGLGIAVLPGNVAANCLSEVRQFAVEICGSIENSGSAQRLRASGELSAEAEGIVRRVLGQAGGNIDVDYLDETFRGVLRDHLAGDRIDVRDCRQNMVAVARQEACITYQLCRRAEFGLEQYANEQRFSGSTGWRGGGYNPDAWCSDYMRKTIASLNIGNQDYAARVVNKREEARWTGWHGRDREYNYHCTVEIQWNPIYKQRRDPICGRE